MKLQFNTRKYTIILQGIARKRRNQEFSCGYTNRCKDGKYIIFLDYDNVELEWIENELKRLQIDFRLGDFYIFRSSEESYHAVCFDKISYSCYINILRNATVCQDYINVPMRWGRKIWTLRLTDKDDVPIKFIKMLVGDNYYEMSSAHVKLLSKLFIDIKFDLDNKRLDNEKELVLSRYPI